MHIGVDIDGVLGDILTITVAELNSAYGKELGVKDICDYDLSRVYGVSREELIDFFKDKEYLLFDIMQPMPGAVLAMKMLKERHSVHIVTARPEFQRAGTEKWLRRHGVPYDSLLLLGNHDKRGVCLELGIEVFVEDRLQNALDLSAEGIRVMLMDAPHNQGELPHMIYRMHSWDEIGKAILEVVA
ncbi:MAG: 5' nucleotidase, NT5C type [Bacillota bacterium]